MTIATQVALRGLVALLVVCHPCLGQPHSAGLNGTVQGQGAALSQVSVQLLRADSRQLLAATLTGSNGRFNFAGLPCSGRYNLAFSRPGWETREVRRLQLRCDDTLEITLVLYPVAEPPRHRAPPGITDQLP